MTDKIFFWLTLWSIAGPELPKNLSQIAKDIQIRPRIAAEVGMEPPYIPPELIVKTTSGPYVVHYPPRDEVHGSHMIQINIDATSQDDAIRKSEQVCARLTASLSLVVGGAPYFAQLLIIKRADQDTQNSDYSQVITITPFPIPESLEELKIKKCVKLFDLIEYDETASNSFIHISTAWQLQTTSGSKPLQRSILQHYVLSMEAIVNGVMSKIRIDRKDEIKAEEKNIRKNFL